MEAISNRDTLNFNKVFIDGTKFEAYANKYTFIWKGKTKTGFISERKVYTCKSCNRCGLRKE